MSETVSFEIAESPKVQIKKIDVVDFCNELRLNFLQGIIVNGIVSHSLTGDIVKLRESQEYLRRLIEIEEKKTKVTNTVVASTIPATSMGFRLN